MRMILRVKSQAMTVSVRVPWRFGSARNEGRSTIVRSGTKLGRSSDWRADQKIANEERVPGVLGEDARLDAKGRVSAAVEVLGEQRFCLRMGKEIGEQRIEMLWRNRVVVVPPDDWIGIGVADDELVFRAAAGVNAGVGDQRSMRGNVGLVALESMLIKLWRAEIPIDAGQIPETEMVGAIVHVM